MSVYDEVEIEDLSFDPVTQIYTYPCPCGDKFSIRLEDMWEFGENIATCPSCTLKILIIFDEEDLPDVREDPDDADASGGQLKGKVDGEKEEQESDDVDDTGSNGLVKQVNQLKLVRVK